MQSTFWNRIEIHLCHDDYSRQKESPESEIVAFFLECTRGAPFSFSFQSSWRRSRLKHDPYKIPLAILACLLVHSEQWEKVSFQLLSSEVGCLCAAKGRLPLLKELEMVIIKDPDYRHTQSMVTSVFEDAPLLTQSTATSVFEDAPLLTQITLCEDSARRFKFNGSTLTIIDLKFLKRYKNFRAVLRGTINLVELGISDIRSEDLHIEGGELFYLPHLERLYIDEVLLLTVLEAPTLQLLSINLWRSDHSHSSRLANLHDARVLVAFLRRLETKLNTIMIHGGYAAPIEDMLQSMPEVDRLALHSVTGIADVFRRLIVPGIGTQELPFTNLIVTWPYFMKKDLYRTDVDALHDMVARRNLPGERCPRPKEIIIQSPEGDHTVAARLKSLCRDRGIRFMFDYELYDDL